MGTLFAFSAALTAMMVTSSNGQGIDQTMIEEAGGPDVVDAVVDRIRARCIFPEDRLFLRRAAYVMSRDGTNPDTYRAGYNGGIWQIDETVFEATRACPAAISSACAAIKTGLNIDWTTVTWLDLRKPLYSGAAAALNTLMQLSGQGMPGDIDEQAKVWATMYGEQADTFSSIASQAITLDCTQKMDLVLILDSSRSVSPSDFNLMLKFAADVVDVIDVSSDVVRVADVVYSGTVRVEFDFNDYTGKDDLKNKILATYKINQGTNTHLALDKAADILFSTSTGARADAKKVAVLVTDGKSNYPAYTVNSAKVLRDKGTTVFSVGVGGYVLKELQDVASDPDCPHVFTLPDFSVIQSILTEIQKSACEATYVFTADKPATGNIGPNGTSVNTETEVPGSNNTIEANVTCGILDVYVSTTDPKPNPAVYENKYQATEGSPAVLTVTEFLSKGTPVYITVVGTRLPDSAAQLKGCSDYTWSLEVTPVKGLSVKCVDNGVPRPCTTDDVIQADLCPKENIVEYPTDNPCKKGQGNKRYPFPNTPTKFLRCDRKGAVYVTLCPAGLAFDAKTERCSVLASDAGPNGSVPLPAGINNPCKAGGTKNYFFKPNRNMYIQCDQSGTASLMQCPPGNKWSRRKSTCVPLKGGTGAGAGSGGSGSTVASTGSAGSGSSSGGVAVECAEDAVPRPCTKDDMVQAGLCPKSVEYPIDNPCKRGQKGRRLPYPQDTTKFLQCDQQGAVYITLCPKGFAFDPKTKKCDILTSGGGLSGAAGRVRLPVGYQNPCASGGNRKNRFKLNKYMFIECDQSGEAWVVPCPPNSRWLNKHRDCVPFKNGRGGTSVPTP